MTRLLVGLVVAAVVFMIYSIIDCALFDRRRVRGLPKAVWLIVIIFVPLVGGALWFLVGRGRRTSSARGRSRTVAPDDDPEFLGRLKRDAARRRSASAGWSRSSPTSMSAPRPRTPTPTSTPTTAPTATSPAERMPEAGAPHSESPASDAAFALLGSFASLGVLDVVVCPGSRSQALALAAAALADEGVLRLHVRLDERGAGFLALGLAVETGRSRLSS